MIFNPAIMSAASGGAKIQVGSYVGNGEYGSATPNSITFDFEPKLVIVTTDSFPSYGSGNGVCDAAYNFQFRWSYGIETATVANTTSGKVYFEQSGNQLKWYTIGTNAKFQFNEDGTTYYYVGIG